MPVLVTRDAVIAYRYTYAPRGSRTSQYRMTFIAHEAVSLWNNLSDPVFDGVGLAGCESRADAFLLALLLFPFLSRTVYPFSSFILWVDIVGLGSSE